MMHRFVRYNKETGEITGHFMVSTTEFMPVPPPHEAYLQLTEPDQSGMLDTIDPERQMPSGNVKNGKLERFALRSRFQGKLVLTTDLPDLDGDGIPELPADGRASVRIKVQVLDEGGRALRTNPPQVKVQTSRGTISKRMLKLERGAGEVELRTVQETTPVQITATAPGFESASLTLEFIPADEYQELTRGQER